MLMEGIIYSKSYFAITRKYDVETKRQDSRSTTRKRPEGRAAGVGEIISLNMSQ